MRTDRHNILDDMEAILSMFPVLTQKLDQPVRTLSGGQQTLVNLGRALMGRPKLRETMNVKVRVTFIQTPVRGAPIRWCGTAGTSPPGLISKGLPRKGIKILHERLSFYIEYCIYCKSLDG